MSAYRSEILGRLSPMRRWLRYWEVALFALSGAVLAFIAGQAFAVRGWWPTSYVEHANIAAEELREAWQDLRRERSEYLTPTRVTRLGLQSQDPSLAWAGYTFITAYRDGRFGASLLDMQGNTVHRWDIAVRDVFDQPPPHLDRLPAEAEVNIHGSAMQPNGDITINLYMTGTVRLDRCSRVVWTLPRGTHHSIDLLPDGDVLMPVRGADASIREPGDAADRSGPTRLLLCGQRPPRRFQWAAGPGDPAARGDPGGRLRPRFGGWRRPLGQAFDEDPLHLNDAEWLRPELTPAFPLFRAGISWCRCARSARS